MQVNLPSDTVERCRSLMNTKETWGAFVERILDENSDHDNLLKKIQLLSAELENLKAAWDIAGIDDIRLAKESDALMRQVRDQKEKTTEELERAALNFKPDQELTKYE